ncbi:hypothetical protein GCM10009808_07410 [Microbacterium sediminicola]|uniref:DUF2993 domain-containing protein n=1 Tax=Microbacterium sediminicola TaxID=415210 RepID=A0ABN2HSG1_9MICO
MLVVALVALIAVATAAELAVRSRFAERLRDVAPTGATVELAGSVVWGYLTGAIAVRATIDEAALSEQIDIRSAGVVQDVWIEDGIHFSTTYDSPIGALPVDIHIHPAIVDGAVTMDVVAVTVQGVPVEVDSWGAGSLPDSLVTDVTPACVELASITTVDGELIVTGEIPTRLADAQGCGVGGGRRG